MQLYEYCNIRVLVSVRSDFGDSQSLAGVHALE